MKTMTSEQLFAEAKARFGEDPRNWKFVCPMCGTVQSLGLVREAVLAFGGTEDNAKKAFARDCIGRYTGQDDAGIAARNRGEKWDKGCNWTLGGFLKCHTLEVVFEGGHKRPTFELAPGTHE